MRGRGRRQLKHSGNLSTATKKSEESARNKDDCEKMFRLRVIENLTTMFCLTCLTVTMSCLAQGVKVSLASQDGPFVVKIVGYDEALQYAVEYDLAPSGSSPKVLSRVKQEPNTKVDFLAVLLRELDRRREVRRQAVKTLNLPSLRDARWVNPSPDGKYLFVGFDDPSRDVMRHAVVLKAADLKIIKEFKLSGSRDIRDSEWSADSQFLAVLETSERFSLSPRDLLYLLASHPILLNTFFVHFLNVGSGGLTETLVAKDVRYGTGIVTRASDRAGLGNKPNTKR